MILRDWRDAPPDLLRACYDSETRSWRDDLGWDTTWTWSTVEEARITWGLPGLLACDDDGGLQGWAFYMQEGTSVQLGGLVASTPRVTTALLEGIIQASRRAETLSCFLRDRAAGLSAALVARGVDVERFLYLSRPVAETEANDACQSEPFSRADALPLASLLAHAYAPEDARHFAPGGTAHDWAGYVSSIIEQRGCGVVDYGAARVARDGHGLQAAAIVTEIGPGIAHLAQLAVRPDCRGRGLASALLREALGAAAAAGKTAMTLLVGEHNAPARRLYAAFGFDERDAFIAGRGAVEMPRAVGQKRAAGVRSYPCHGQPIAS